MSYSDHSFDWRGFAYASSAVAVFLFVASVVQYLYPIAQPHLAQKNHTPASTIPSAFAALDQREAATTTASAVWMNLSSTTPQRVINALTIADVIPAHGKFIAADLKAMKLYMYENGSSTAEYTIKSKGKPGTAWETPGGYYTVGAMEEKHLSTVGKVYMPYSMQFYGNYFIHGWPYYPDGTPVASTFSGGCIRLSTKDAEKVYAFAERGTGIFVYDPKDHGATSTPPIALSPMPVPTVSASSYIVADMDTGDVYLEHNASSTAMADSVTNMMTALVANENITFDKHLTIHEGDLLHPEDPKNVSPKEFLIGDTLYPLLMESRDGVASVIASFQGEGHFVAEMNRAARALDMAMTHFETVHDTSEKNVSSTDDMYRLAVYLANKKSFVWNILRTSEKKLTAADGSKYSFYNDNALAQTKYFAGSSVGVGTTTVVREEAQSTSTVSSIATTSEREVERKTITRNSVVTQFNVPMKDKTHRVAVIVLGTDDFVKDTKSLLNWFTTSAERAGAMKGTACVSCTKVQTYRRIEL